MPFQAYLPVGFTHSHENRIFEQLSSTLTAEFGSSPEPVYLIGNAMFDDKELDAVLLKSDALFVIEMKDHGGMIHFSETTEWFADESDLDLKELERLFDQDFEKWMLHLHKDQENLAKADFDKPVVLTGVSGSGKTCILVHRARYLARKYPGERIAILTLNRSWPAFCETWSTAYVSTERPRIFM